LHEVHAIVNTLFHWDDAIADEAEWQLVGAPDQDLPPFFFFRKFWRDSYFAVLGKSGW
jgi:hypothetical protein